MGYLIKKRNLLRFNLSIRKLALIAILTTFSAALIDTIWAIYLDSYLNSLTLVGFFSSALTFISFISFFLFIPMIEKKDKEKLYIFALVISIFSYILFSFVEEIKAIFFLALLLTLAINLRISSWGIIVRDKSKRKELTKNEGILYTVYNAGWLIGPPVAGYIASRFNFKGVFFSAALILFIALILFVRFKIKDHKKTKHIDENVLKNFIDFFKSKDRVVAYLLGGGGNFWWVLIYLFMPLYIVREGFGIFGLSIFFMAVLLPSVLFAYPFARLASKIGHKKIFITGYAVLSAATLACFLLGNIYLIFAFLVIASIGISMLESTTEAYFFDISTNEEVYRFFAPFNTSIDANHLVAKFLPSVILIFLPFRFVFLFFGIFMIGFCVLATWTRNIIEARRKG